MSTSSTLVPYVVVRANNLPLDSLSALMGAQQSEQRLAALHTARERLDAMRGQVCALLFELASTGCAEYRLMIAAKRAIFSRAAIASVLARFGKLLASHDALLPWLRQAQAVQQQEAALLALFDRATEDARAAARVLVRQPSFLQGLAMTRGQVYRAALAYAGSVSVQGKKALNDEETLFRYLTRGIAKVSPFSSFTSVGFAPLQAGAEERATLLRSRRSEDRFSLDRATLMKLFERFLLRHYAHWRFRLTENCREVDGEQHYYLFGDRADVYPYRTSFSKTRFPNVALFAAEDGQPGWLSWNTIAQRLPAGADPAAVLQKWLMAGVLNFQPRLDEESAHLLQDFLAIARSVAATDASAAPVAEVLAEMDTAYRQFPGADPATLFERVDALHGGLQTLSALLGWPLVKTGGLVYHDSYLPELAPLSEAMVGNYGAQIREFVAHYLGYNFNSGYSDAMLATLRAALAGGRTMKVFDFYELVQQTVARHAADRVQPESKTLRLIGLYEQIWARRGAAEIVLDAVPAAPARGISFAAYGHLMDGCFVLNNIDSGYLRCYSRFFTFGASGDVLEQCRAAYGAELEEAYDIYDTFGFNTAFRPRICGRRIWLDGAPDSGGADVRLSELSVHWPEQAAYPVLSAGPGGRPVHLRQTGLFVKELYPRLLEMLMRFSMADAPCYFAFRFGLHKMVADAGQRGVIRIPRIRYRDVVLSRQQWWVDRDSLPQRAAGEEAARYLLRLDAWRRAHGLPQRVFLRRHLAAKVLDRDVSNGKKPVLLDFAAPIMARMTGRMFSSAFDLASLEEVLPDSDNAYASHGGQRYASEIIFEVTPGTPTL
ncbi:lantibiotic dehydratase [Janthinobacterium agaricidamnosum]|uniref:Lantibiotic dehydratase N-terminal domain-containing protein n=1 Tax=Janthinobacterium agaricidamnosum NBRC 102515 = DSM 9628 TaxID=1349767 RepID=W0VEY8_9BURK|nr:lantibiotic dehydratase [Janthinobacterium agaricidamnosum]CDG85917.1 hypothetical protein GJA_5321 [Janthinobacterium agaricidamnosum NBRC 102515 = DSM 9628]